MFSPFAISGFSLQFQEHSAVSTAAFKNTNNALHTRATEYGNWYCEDVYATILVQNYTLTIQTTLASLILLRLKNLRRTHVLC